uniref:Putative WW-binding domain and destruction box n=1 Tax=Herelleviridae sp. cttEB8 TaxID=2825832 RepID=A0A8S5P5K0_9CAUD|nr:MAG TPA: putative WW-binding domain and destruction box [Herelleviridae sp. cttEB8]
MKAGKKGEVRERESRLFVFSSYLFWRCYPSLSAVLCKYLCNYVLYM